MLIEYFFFHLKIGAKRVGDEYWNGTKKLKKKLIFGSKKIYANFRNVVGFSMHI